MRVKVMVFPDDYPATLDDQRVLIVDRVLPETNFESTRVDLTHVIADAMACELMLALREKCRDQEEPK